MSKRIERIIDANLNRAGEGLHFLEEVARLVLDDAALTQNLKTIRHEILRGDWGFNRRLVQSRDAASDVGFDIELENEPRELPVAVVANSRRVQEALRILEEMAKLPETAPEMEAVKFKKARFALYAIEQELLGRLTRLDKLNGLTGLYAILDIQALGKRKYLKVAQEMIKGGASTIQLRDKFTPRAELLNIALELRKLCVEKGVLFIVNDYLDIALASNADGLHLGQEDLPLSIARKLLPADMILGGSVNTVEQAKAAEAAGADYIAVGAMYPTPSKEKPNVVGVERLRKVRGTVSVLLVAIGGIDEENAGEVAANGADAVAVIGALMNAEDIAEAARNLIKSFEAGK
ncbi:MAG: thiamine phosphate synthase [Dehalococcoidia bacterium]|jgi:thiamine-phosphate pyrophosphorylase